MTSCAHTRRAALHVVTGRPGWSLSGGWRLRNVPGTLVQSEEDGTGVCVGVGSGLEQDREPLHPAGETGAATLRAPAAL